jgi:hypothetical protein
MGFPMKPSIDWWERHPAAMGFPTNFGRGRMPLPPDTGTNMQPDFWQQRWRENQIGFHQSTSFKDLDEYVGARATRGGLLPRGWQKVDGLDVQ